MSQNSHLQPTGILRELAFLFLRLGATSFGGPAAHIALMEEEVVRRRKWLTHAEFLDLLGATNLIPGPNSTEMAIHVGYKMGGWRGLLIAGSLFIMPAFLIVWGIAWFYQTYGALPAVQSLFHAVKPVILAIIAQAIWNLSRSAIKDRLLGLIAVFSLGLYLLWGNELLVLFLFALANLLFRLKPSPNHTRAMIWPLFLYFAKVGSVLFGSGYVLIAFLHNDLVNRYHWITEQQLLDAITVGQFTPGPVFTTATFIGYLVGGHAGAVAATVGIFAPAFCFVALSAPILPRLRRSVRTAHVLDGLNVVSLSLMAGAALGLARGTVVNVYGAFVFVASLLVLIRFKINSVWLILIAAVVQIAQHFLG